MSNESTRQYTTEFKESAIKLAVESDQRIIDTAREPGVNISILRTWIKEYHQPKQSARKVNNEHIRNKNKRLHKEVDRLKEDVEISGKATDFFARESH